jgi:hypothetical protein
MRNQVQVKLRLTETDRVALYAHLFPGDGLEAVAIALCGRRAGATHHVLTVRQVVVIPYNECKVRTSERVTWSTQRLIPLLELAAKYDLAILKIHSHPGGYAAFSMTDDASDLDLFGSVFGWTDSQLPHASAVMLPDGSMFGRAIQTDLSFQPLTSILVPGADIHFWPTGIGGALPSFMERHGQLFGSGTTNRLRSLSVSVVGCSGTGSPVIEQLVRLGVGRLIIIDPDRVEDKNLNRILNASREDAYLCRPKVEVAARAIAAAGLGTELEIIAENLTTPRAVRAVAECDLVFGCMDSVEGRHLLNRLCAFYILPYFDIGVRLVADGKGGVNEVSGAVHYLRPDGSTLFDRKVYTLDGLKAEGIRRTDPEAYRAHLRAGYLRGVQEDRPAVISINMAMASLAVNEFLARFHPYRYDSNAESAIVRMDFVGNVVHRELDGEADGMFFSHIGKGDVRPLLSMPELSESKDVR